MPGWFRCFDERPSAAVRLICFPYAGGSAAFYRQWRPPPSIEVCAVQYPGRVDRISEPLVSDAVTLAKMIVDASYPLLDRPVALFGHSMGALVAYEVARMLPVAPVALFVSGAVAAHDEHRDDPIWELPDAAFVEELARLGGSDIEVLADKELRELVLPGIRNDFRLVARYIHKEGPPLSCPIHAFAGDADPIVAPSRPARWAELTTGPSTVTVLPGDHFFLIPHQRTVLERLSAELRRPEAARD